VGRTPQASRLDAAGPRSSRSFRHSALAADGLRWLSSACANGPYADDLMLAHHGDKAIHNLTSHRAGVDRPVIDYRWSKDGGLLAMWRMVSTLRSSLSFNPGSALREVRGGYRQSKSFAFPIPARRFCRSNRPTTPQDYGFWDKRAHRSKSLHLMIRGTVSAQRPGVSTNTRASTAWKSKRSSEIGLLGYDGNRSGAARPDPRGPRVGAPGRIHRSLGPQASWRRAATRSLAPISRVARFDGENSSR